jgi:hypothetical protein
VLVTSCVGTAVYNIEGILKKEEKIEGNKIQGRRSKQLLDDVKEKNGYWSLKQEAKNCTLLRRPVCEVDLPLLHLVTRLRMNGVVLPLPHTRLWHLAGKFSLSYGGWWMLVLI